MRPGGTIFLYFIGLLFGIICVNIGFDITKLSYSTHQSWSMEHYVFLLLRRGTELSLLMFMMRLLPKKWARVCLIILTGGIVGGLASICASTETFVQTFLFGCLTFAFTVCYMLVVGLSPDVWSDDLIYGKRSARRVWLRRFRVVTILLLTCVGELKIANFF